MKLTILLFVGLVFSVARTGAEGEEKEGGDSAESEVAASVVVEPTDEPDPFGADYNGLGGSSSRKLAAGRRNVVGQTVLVRLESYDVKTATVIALLDAWEAKKGAGVVRQQALDLAKTGEAEVADLYALTVEAGVAHTIDSLREYIYPTEYEPSGLGDFVPLAAPEQAPAGSLLEALDMIDDTIVPKAFETRSTGNSLGIEVQDVAAEKDTWDVAIVPEAVEVAGVLEWGIPGLGAKMPQFVVLRSDTVLRVREGEWSLVCVQTPFDDKGERRQDTRRMMFLKIERAR